MTRLHKKNQYQEDNIRDVQIEIRIESYSSCATKNLPIAPHSELAKISSPSSGRAAYTTSPIITTNEIRAKNAQLC